MSRHTKMNKYVKEEMDLMDELDEEEEDNNFDQYNDGTHCLIQINGNSSNKLQI